MAAVMAGSGQLSSDTLWRPKRAYGRPRHLRVDVEAIRDHGQVPERRPHERVLRDVSHRVVVGESGRRQAPVTPGATSTASSKELAYP